MQTLLLGSEEYKGSVRGTIRKGRWAVVSAASGHLVGNPPKWVGSNRVGLGRKEAFSSFKHNTVYCNSSYNPRNVEEGSCRMGSKGSPYSPRDWPGKSYTYMETMLTCMDAGALGARPRSGTAHSGSSPLLESPPSAGMSRTPEGVGFASSFPSSFPSFLAEDTASSTFP